MSNSYTDIVERFGCYNTAHGKYLAFVKAFRKDGFDYADNVSSYTGTFELSEIEAQMFRIDLVNVPSLYWAYERYENLVGSMDTYFGEFKTQERVDYARFFSGDLIWSFDTAVAFMAEVTGLPCSQCRAWVCKIQASYIRGGLYDAA